MIAKESFCECQKKGIHIHFTPNITHSEQYDIVMMRNEKELFCERQKERKLCMQYLLEEALTVANSWQSILMMGEGLEPSEKQEERSQEVKLP